MPEDRLSPPITVTTGPLPSSRKVYVAGTRQTDLRVAMREIALSAGAGEPPVQVYDPSGPYSDPAVKVDIHAGLPALRDGRRGSPASDTEFLGSMALAGLHPAGGGVLGIGPLFPVEDGGPAAASCQRLAHRPPGGGLGDARRPGAVVPGAPAVP